MAKSMSRASVVPDDPGRRVWHNNMRSWVSHEKLSECPSPLCGLMEQPTSPRTISKRGILQRKLEISHMCCVVWPRHVNFLTVCACREGSLQDKSTSIGAWCVSWNPSWPLWDILVVSVESPSLLTRLFFFHHPSLPHFFHLLLTLSFLAVFPLPLSPPPPLLSLYRLGTGTR